MKKGSVQNVQKHILKEQKINIKDEVFTWWNYMRTHLLIHSDEALLFWSIENE